MWIIYKMPHHITSHGDIDISADIMIQHKDAIMVCCDRSPKPDSRVHIIVRCPTRVRKISDVAIHNRQVYSVPVTYKGDRRNTIVGFTDKVLCASTATSMPEWDHMRVGSIRVRQLKHLAGLMSMPVVIIDGVYVDVSSGRTVVEVCAAR